MRNLDEKASQAKEKKAAIGPDIDLGAYEAGPVPHSYVKDLGSLSETEKNRIIQVGIDAGETERSGTYLQKDTSVIHACSRQKGIEVLPIKEAIKEYDWLKDYYCKLVPVDTDKYTARAHLELHSYHRMRIGAALEARAPSRYNRVFRQKRCQAHLYHDP